MKSENIQLAENETIDEMEEIAGSLESKRHDLKRTKILKQTWSIVEIFQKMKVGKLILDPEYQRNLVWKMDKKIPFIESLFMGIIIPPIYVVEIQSEDDLIENKYEVVDGKQRLSTLSDFLNDNLKLNEKYLEYYADLFKNKRFNEIRKDYPDITSNMLSSVLDIYVISANSPEFTKYDIFSRLNKGSAPLKVNEIRRAIYASNVMTKIDDFIDKVKTSNPYKNAFTKTAITHYDDYGRFFSSIAFYIRINKETKTVENYNSRPREMINDVLSKLQNNSEMISDEEIDDILKYTLELYSELKNIKGGQYIVDLCVYFMMENKEVFDNKLDVILNDPTIKETLERSPSTTSNVNARLSRIFEIMSD